MSHHDSVMNKMLRMRKANLIQVGNITLPAVVTEELEHIGWSLPGGTVVKDRKHAINVGKTLDRLYVRSGGK